MTAPPPDYYGIAYANDIKAELLLFSDERLIVMLGRHCRLSSDVGEPQARRCGRYGQQVFMCTARFGPVEENAPSRRRCTNLAYFCPKAPDVHLWIPIQE
jgi:hypothetical protein